MWTPYNKGVKWDIKPQLTIWNIVFFLMACYAIYISSVIKNNNITI